MTQLTSISIPNALAALKKADISSTELTTACLQQVEKLEPAVHAFITLTPEKALAQAEQADRLYADWRKDNQQPLPAGTVTI